LESFPTRAEIAVFFGLIDGRGDLPVKLAFMDLDDLFSIADESEAVGTLEGTIHLPDPLAPVHATSPSRQSLTIRESMN
jgi:hypothetical protein